VDHLPAHGAMVILGLLDLAAGLILHDHAALQATAAETGQHLDAVQSQLDSELAHSHLQRWIGAERAFRDDTLSYSLCGFDLHPLEALLVDVNRRLKRKPSMQDGCKATWWRCKLGRRNTKPWKSARKMLDGEISGSVRASDIWPA
jgi:hypothetical protein